MEHVHIREANSEVLVFLDRNMGDKLNALLEAIRILQREVIRERINPNQSSSR